MYLAPVTGSNPPLLAGNRQPRSSLIGSVSVRPMTCSRPSSARTISARWDQGQASDAYSW